MRHEAAGDHKEVYRDIHAIERAIEGVVLLLRGGGPLLNSSLLNEMVVPYSRPPLFSEVLSK